LAHVSCAAGAKNSVAAGVDSITHGIFLDDESVQAMKEKGVFLVPTLSVYHSLVQQESTGVVPEHMWRKAKQMIDAHGESFKLALKAGVKIAAGTDSGFDWNPMGENLHFEFEIMNRLGMAPMDVIVSATSGAAECLRMTKDIGTVEVGKLADLVVLDGDPLANISNIRKIRAVYKEGRLVVQTAG
jgi:imidazolonepropionase-like amidohydrolase